MVDPFEVQARIRTAPARRRAFVALTFFGWFHSLGKAGR